MGFNQQMSITPQAMSKLRDVRSLLSMEVFNKPEALSYASTVELLCILFNEQKEAQQLPDHGGLVRRVKELGAMRRGRPRKWKDGPFGRILIEEETLSDGHHFPAFQRNRELTECIACGYVWNRGKQKREDIQSCGTHKPKAHEKQYFQADTTAPDGPVDGEADQR